jgi:hypothetical protein
MDILHYAPQVGQIYKNEFGDLFLITQLSVENPSYFCSSECIWSKNIAYIGTCYGKIVIYKHLYSLVC